MAKLDKMPEQAIISGYKGTLDFYLFMGIPCARAWPRSPGKLRTPAVMAQWPIFAAATKIWATLSESEKQIWNAMARGTGISGRDLQIKAYITGSFTYDPAHTP